MSVLEVSGLTKRYPAFALEGVSFSLRERAITGFIGRNGAGKTTTLSSLLGLTCPDGGEARFFGLPFRGHEGEIKGRLGYVSGGVRFYPAKRLRAITAVTRSFYPRWDEGAYQDYLRRFDLDENKTPAQLSQGMKVKYALALALSHRAELLILDEPTSGLDPVSREDLLEVFLTLRREGITILFSTHITEDLDKCADDILYIRKGRLVERGGLDEFAARYRLAMVTGEQLARMDRTLVLGCRENRTGYTVLVRAEDAPGLGVPTQAADLDAIMVHLEQEGRV